MEDDFTAVKNFQRVTLSHWLVLIGFVIFPQLSRGEDTFIPPMIYRSQTAERSKLTVFPFFHRETTKAGGSLTLTPVFGYQRTATKRQGFAGPVLWHRSDEQSGFAVAPLFFRWSKAEDTSSNTLIVPLLFHRTAKSDTANVIFPFFWRFTEPTQRSLVLFPFYWRDRDWTNKESWNTDVVFPIFWDFRNKQQGGGLLGPLFWHFKPEVKGIGLAPLFYYHRNQSASHLGALPFIYYGHDFREKRRTWVVGPAYFRRVEQDGYRAGLLPIYFHKRSADQNYTVLAPVIWHFARPKEQWSTSFFGPAFHFRRKDVRGFGLAPLFYRSDDQSPEGKRGSSTAVAPLFFYHHSPSKKSVYTALFGFRTVEKSRLWYVFPYLRQRGDASNTDVIFPLGFRHTKNIEDETMALCLPSYYGRWSPFQSMHILFPIFWYNRRVDETARVLFPLFWDFDNLYEDRLTIAFPLFARYRNHVADSTQIVVPPGIWVRRKPAGTDMLVPPVFLRLKNGSHGTTVGFPLYWDFQRPFQRTTVFFPLFWRFDDPLKRSYLVFNTWYSKHKKTGESYLVVFPFFDVAKKPPTDVAVDVLGGLFGYAREGEQRTMRLFFVPIKLGSTSKKSLSGFGGTLKGSRSQTAYW